MNRTYLTALSAVGVAALVALTLSLFPTPQKPASTSLLGSTAPAPFQQVRVYRTPGGGLVRTDILRWQGPGSMTIVTWSSHANPGQALPPWVGMELQNMQAQQQLLAAALQQMMPMSPVFGGQGAWTFEGPLSLKVQWPKREQAAMPAPEHPLRHGPRTVDL
jgi:hypothetical protein